MIDIGKDLQRAYDDGYWQGVKDTLDDIHKTLERSLKEQFSHLTENSSEIPNNSTCSKMEQVDKDINVRSKDEPQTCSVNGRPYDCGNCEYHKCTADEPQTEDEILREQCRAFMGIVEQTERSE